MWKSLGWVHFGRVWCLGGHYWRYVILALQLPKYRVLGSSSSRMLQLEEAMNGVVALLV